MSWWEISEFLSKLVNVGTVHSLGQNNKNTAKKLINMWIVENRNTRGTLTQSRLANTPSVTFLQCFS